MSTPHIRLIGDPVLRTPAREITASTPELQELVLKMERIMEAAGGVGLAAPQIGIALRIFTWKVDNDRGHIVNPTIENHGQPTSSHSSEGADIQAPRGQAPLREGCLSIPGVQANPTRFRRSTISGHTSDGTPITRTGSGLLAHCFQHEIDHLDGVLFIDRLTGEQRKVVLRSLRHPRPALVPGGRR